jgi:hypothetical protein
VKIWAMGLVVLVAALARCCSSYRVRCTPDALGGLFALLAALHLFSTTAMGIFLPRWRAACRSSACC